MAQKRPWPSARSIDLASLGPRSAAPFLRWPSSSWPQPGPAGERRSCTA